MVSPVETVLPADRDPPVRPVNKDLPVNPVSKEPRVNEVHRANVDQLDPQDQRVKLELVDPLDQQVCLMSFNAFMHLHVHVLHVIWVCTCFRLLGLTFVFLFFCT